MVKRQVIDDDQNAEAEVGRKLKSDTRTRAATAICWKQAGSELNALNASIRCMQLVGKIRFGNADRAQDKANYWSAFENKGELDN